MSPSHVLLFQTHAICDVIMRYSAILPCGPSNRFPPSLISSVKMMSWLCKCYGDKMLQLHNLDVPRLASITPESDMNIHNCIELNNHFLTRKLTYSSRIHQSAQTQKYLTFAELDNATAIVFRGKELWSSSMCSAAAL
uniref:Uncharacterized protein n=1 Tax=Arundo donax TaxID=35708 RepID=A0A0A8ZKD4_ARUDO